MDVDVDVGQDDYWDEDLNRVVLFGPISADRVRENGSFGTIPAAVAFQGICMQMPCGSQNHKLHQKCTFLVKNILQSHDHIQL